MMVVDDIGTILRPEHHWYHMAGEKYAGLVAMLCAPLLAFGFNLAHADGDLGWAKVRKQC
jgi:hypothetical protein